MVKKYIFSILVSVAFLLAGPVLAIANCDNQPKPAFSCPAGYSIMCISAGGDHWGCGKESNGQIVEWTETKVKVDAGVQANSETDSATSAYRECGAKCRDQYGGSGSAGFDACIRSCGAVGSAGLRENSQNSSGESENETTDRQTPKRDFGDKKVTIMTGAEAKVTVIGWDAEKKEEIQGSIEAQLESDNAIKLVEISENNVAMVYATPAKLFGFINITMNLHISADQEGRVKVNFPWYRFLVKTEFAKAQENLEYVFQNNETDLEFLNAKGSAEAQVGIFITISRAMHEMSKSIIQNIRA